MPSPWPSPSRGSVRSSSRSGLHRGATQFFARYEEAGDHRRLVGTILFNIAVIVGLGLLLFMAVALAQDLLTSSGLLDPNATTLLLILVLLAPIDALDDMLIALFAVLGGSRRSSCAGTW